jgi:hypothetical protein
MLPPGRARPSTKPVATAGDDDRRVLGRRLGGERGGITERDEDVDVGFLEFGHETLEPLGARLCRPLRDDEVLALDEAARRQRGDERFTPIVEHTHGGAGGQ